MKNLRRFLALLLVVCMLPLSAVRAHPFTDVPVGCWFEESVDYVYDNGLMNGTSETVFSPEKDMNRAMVVTVLYRMAGSPEISGAPSPFTDVDHGAFYGKPVAWAYENGIVQGISNTEFAPGASVNRSQLVTFFYRFANYLGCEMDARADLSTYTDAQTVPAFATDAFSWAVAHGIVQGVSSTSLAPAGTANRAQCATILCRVAKLVGFEPILPPEEYELSMAKNKITMRVGETYTMAVVYTGYNSLTWVSSHENIATVSQNGEIAAVSEGTAYVTVKDGVKNATCKVIVEAAPTLTVNVTEATMNVGSTYQVNYTYTGDVADLTWRSRNESVATVDNNGVVTAVAAGNAKIVVSDGNTSKQCTIKVVQGQVMAEEIVVVNTDGPFDNGVTRYKGDYVVLTLANLPNEATQEAFASSSNTDIVTTSVEYVNGGFCKVTLTFKAAGTATITLTSGDGAVSQSYTITVKDGYDFDPGDRQLTPEEFADYTTKVMCANGFTEADCSGWLQLTLSADELTFDRAISIAYARGHEWWAIGKRYCQFVYIGQNTDGNYVFHQCVA